MEIKSRSNYKQQSKLTDGMKIVQQINDSLNRFAIRGNNQQHFHLNRYIVRHIPYVPYSAIQFPTHQQASQYLLNHQTIGDRQLIAYCQTNSDIILFGNSLPRLPYPNSKLATPNCVPGLLMRHNFILENEEQALISLVDSLSDWTALKNRRVLHLGHTFVYGTNTAGPNQNEGIYLEWVQLIKKQVEALISLPTPYFDQITINDYQPGAGIPAHCDSHSPFQQPIAVISLGGSVAIEWNQSKNHHACQTKQQFMGNTIAQEIAPSHSYSTYIPNRSLMVMLGPSRYGYSHGIASRKVDLVDGILRIRNRRISITFRKVKINGKCDCIYKEWCDQ